VKVNFYIFIYLNKSKMFFFVLFQVLLNHIHEVDLNLGLHHIILNLYFLQINNQLFLKIILIIHQKIFFQNGKIKIINIMDLINEILVLIYILQLNNHNNNNILPIFKNFVIDHFTHKHTTNSVK